MDVARTQRVAFQIAELIEQEQRMITGTGEVAIVGGAFLIVVDWADTRFHIEHHRPRRLAALNAVDPLPGDPSVARQWIDRLLITPPSCGSFQRRRDTL